MLSWNLSRSKPSYTFLNPIIMDSTACYWNVLATCSINVVTDHMSKNGGLEWRTFNTNACKNKPLQYVYEVNVESTLTSHLFCFFWRIFQWLLCRGGTRIYDTKQLKRQEKSSRTVVSTSFVLFITKLATGMWVEWANYSWIRTEWLNLIDTVNSFTGKDN